MEDDQEEKYGNLLLYMITAARMVYAQYWKKENIPTKEERMMKLMELAQMAKRTILLKDKNILKFKEMWQPILEYLYTSENYEAMTLGFLFKGSKQIEIITRCGKIKIRKRHIKILIVYL